MRVLLASTDWNGDMATIGSYVPVTSSRTGSVIHGDPSGVAAGTSYLVSMLQSVGPISLSTLLASYGG